ncbi:MAG: YfhO family protein, partial [Deltaproteobacteria bacterium]|nr:YfhO family protein [Deltaproteobacteria bacterium]
RRWYSVLCLLSAAGLILAATYYTTNPQFFLRVLGHDLLRAGGLLLLLSLLFALTRVPVRGKAYLVVGLCMLDVLSIHRHLLPSVPLAEIRSTETLPVLQKQDQFPLRVYSNFLNLPAEIQDDQQWQFQKALLALGSGSFYGISNVNAPSGVTLQDEEFLQETIHAIPKEKIIEYLGSLSVSVLPSSKVLPYHDLELRKNSALKDVFVYDLKTSQPRYKLVDKLHTLPSQDAVRASLPTSSFGEAALGSNPYTEDRVREVTPLSPQDSVSLMHYSPQRLEFRAELAAPALLILNEAYHRGWSAQINGRDFPVLRANYFLRAVFLPAGRSEIIFSYATPGLLLGAFISIVTILGLAVALSKQNGTPKKLEG